MRVLSLNLNVKFYNFLKFFILILFLLFNPVNVKSAELLQINQPDTILVGDQNRTLVLSLYCIDVEEKNKTKALNLLNKNFPRGTKVKIKPYEIKENKLTAKVYKIGRDIEMTELLKSNDVSKETCND